MNFFRPFFAISYIAVYAHLTGDKGLFHHESSV